MLTGHTQIILINIEGQIKIILIDMEGHIQIILDKPHKLDNLENRPKRVHQEMTIQFACTCNNRIIQKLAVDYLAEQRYPPIGLFRMHDVHGTAASLLR